MPPSNRYPVISNVTEKKTWVAVVQDTAAQIDRFANTNRRFKQFIDDSKDGDTFSANDPDIVNIVASDKPTVKSGVSTWTAPLPDGIADFNAKGYVYNSSTQTIVKADPIKSVADDAPLQSKVFISFAEQDDFHLLADGVQVHTATVAKFQPVVAVTFNSRGSTFSLSPGDTIYNKMADTATQLVPGQSLKTKPVLLAHLAFPNPANEQIIQQLLPFITPLGAYGMVVAGISKDLYTKANLLGFNVFHQTTRMLTHCRNWKDNVFRTDTTTTYNKVIIRSIAGQTPVFTTGDLTSYFGSAAPTPFNNWRQVTLNALHNQSVEVKLHADFQRLINEETEIIINVIEEPVQESTKFKDATDPYGQSTSIASGDADISFDDYDPTTFSENSIDDILNDCCFKSTEGDTSAPRDKPIPYTEILKDTQVVQAMINLSQNTDIMTRNGQEFVLQNRANIMLFVHDQRITEDETTFETVTLKTGHYSSPNKARFVFVDASKDVALSSPYAQKKRTSNADKFVRFKWSIRKNKYVILETNVRHETAENAVIAMSIQHNVNPPTLSGAAATTTTYNALKAGFVTTVGAVFPESMFSGTFATQSLPTLKTERFETFVEWPNGTEPPQIITANQWTADIIQGSLHSTSHKETLAKATYGIATTDAAPYAEKATSTIAHEFYKTANLIVQENTQVQFKMHIVRSVLMNLRTAFAPETYESKFGGSNFVLLKAFDQPQTVKKPHDKGFLFIQPMATSKFDIDSPHARIIAGITQPTQKGVVAINSYKLRAVDIEKRTSEAEPGYKALIFPKEATKDEGDLTDPEEDEEDALEEPVITPTDEHDDDDETHQRTTSAKVITKKRDKQPKVDERKVDGPQIQDIWGPNGRTLAFSNTQKTKDTNPFAPPSDTASWSQGTSFSVTGTNGLFYDGQRPMDRLQSKAYAIEAGGFKQPELHAEKVAYFDTSKLKSTQKDIMYMDAKDLRKGMSGFEKFILDPVIASIDAEEQQLDIRPEDIIKTQTSDITKVGKGFKMKLTHWYNQLAFRQYAQSLQSALKRARIEAEEDAIDLPDLQRENVYEQFAHSTIQNHKQRSEQVTEYVQLVAFLVVAAQPTQQRIRTKLKLNGKRQLGLITKQNSNGTITIRFDNNVEHKSINPEDVDIVGTEHAVGKFITRKLNQQSADPIKILRNYVLRYTKHIKGSTKADQFAHETATLFKQLIKEKEKKENHIVMVKSSRQIAATEYIDTIIFDAKNEWAYGNKTIEAIAAAFHAIDIIVAHKDGFSPFSIAKSLADSFAGWTYTPQYEPQPVAAVATHTSVVYKFVTDRIKKNGNIVKLNNNQFYKLIYNGGNNPLRGTHTTKMATQVTAHLAHDHAQLPQLVEINGYIAKTSFFYAIQDEIMILLNQQALKPQQQKQQQHRRNSIAAFIAQNPRKNYNTFAALTTGPNATDQLIHTTAPFKVNQPTLARAFQAAAVLHTMTQDAGKRFKDPLAKQQSKQTLNQTIIAIINA
jgi:hypothetical protein